MGWLLDNMRALDEFQTNDEKRARQAKDDAYTEEQRNIARTKYQRDEDARTAGQSLMTDMSSGLSDDGGFSAQKHLGITPVAPTTDQVAPDPSQPVIKQPTYADSAKSGLKSQLSYLQKIGDVNGFKSVFDQYKRLQLGERSAQIKNYILNAPQEEIDQVMKNVSIDPRNDYDIKKNNQGYYELSLGNTKATLNRNQLGSWMAAKDRLAQGDDSAWADLAAVDKGLTDQLAAKLATNHTIATTNNAAINYGDKNEAALQKIIMQGAINEARMGNAAAALELKKAQAEKTATGKETGPKWIDVKDDQNVMHRVDANTGAEMQVTSAVPDIPAERHWYGDKPAVPGTPSKVKLMLGGQEVTLDQLYPKVAAKIGSSVPAAAPAPQAIPQNHINALKSNPALAAKFDAQYGPGSAAKILGTAQ